MTGELFALLSKQSVLRHSVTAATEALDAAAFDEAVSTTLSRPETIMARLFAHPRCRPAAGRARRDRRAAGCRAC